MAPKNLFLLLTAVILLLPQIVSAQSGWYQISSGTSNPLYSVSFPSANTGYAVGGAGTILVTTNAGVNWSQQSNPASYDLEGVCFLNSLTGYACGAQGTVLSTTNGGTNWLLLTTPSNQMLWSIFFINTQTGWSCGQLGQIFYTTNSGANWTMEMSTTSEYMRHVFFMNAATGICTGRNGKIIRTTNAGATWYDVGPGGTSTLYDCYFINSTTGWAGGFGTVVTTNAGSNWSLEQSSGIVLAITFSSPLNGWEAGDDGTMNYTTNGGANWFAQNFSFNNWLYGIQFTSLSTGYIVGDAGIILKTTDGGGLFTGVKQVSNNVPQGFKLFQNYPNPFNPTTFIKFQISPPLRTNGAPLPLSGGDAVGVNLIIYDILGKEVAILVNQQLQSGGYEVEWNASNFPSGVYYYKLSAGVYSQTNKMVLIK